MRAIILAAGMGTRLRPLTDSMPKALVEIFGESFFSRQLRFLEAAGMSGVTVVTGYKAEAFLPYQGRPGLEFIQNDHYHDRNNLWSLYLVRDRLYADPEGCIVLEGDVWLGSSILPNRPLRRSSWFVGPRDCIKQEWAVRCDAADRVLSIEVTAGREWILTGLSYWRAQDGRGIASRLEQAILEPGFEDRFWDEVPRSLLGSIEVGAVRIGADDWAEIDDLAERQVLEDRIRSAVERGEHIPLAANRAKD